VKEIDIIPDSAAVSRSGSTVFYGWVVVFFAVFAIAVTNGILLGGMPFFYQSFIAEFGWNRTTIATAGSVLLVSRGLSGPFAGPLWDRYGPKRFMVIGAAIIGAALAFITRIGGPPQLYLALFVMSVGFTFAGIGPGAYLASSWFTRKRGVAMGIVGTATSLGGMIFSPISTRLIGGYGWRGAMMVYAAIMFVVFAPLMYFFIRNRPAEIGASADPDESDWFLRRRTPIKSVAAAAAVVGALIYSPVAHFLTSRFGKPGATLIFTALGIICLGALMKYFAAREETAAAVTKSSPDPSSGATMSEAIGSGSYWTLLLGSALCYSTIFAIVQQFILHVRSPNVGFSPAEAAWAYSTLFFFSLAGKSFFGFLSDRFEKRSVNLACCLMTLAGALLVLKISQSNVWFFCLLFGLGYGGITVTTRLVLAELFGLRSLGKLLAIMMSAETLLGGGGNFLTGRLFDVTGSYQAAFKVMAVCSVVSAILMAMLGRRPPAWKQKNADTNGVSPNFSG
jgi:MFS family permease